MPKKAVKPKNEPVRRALSVRQPFAHLIIHGGKNVENRTWATRYRGPLAIHASGTMRKQLARKYGLDPEKLLTGHVVGIVDIVDCVDDSRSRWAEKGSWHWILKNPRPLRNPVKRKGKLGIFRLGTPVRAGRAKS